VTSDTDGASADSVRISARDVAALRAMRPILRRALSVAGDAMTSGALREATELQVRRAIDALTVIDRLTGDEPDGCSRDEQILAVIRVARAAGYDVTFGRDGELTFSSDDAELLVSDELLDVGETLDEQLTAFLADVSDGGASLDAWIRSHHRGAAE
jgi:hypothetical protein